MKNLSWVILLVAILFLPKCQKPKVSLNEIPINEINNKKNSSARHITFSNTDIPVVSVAASTELTALSSLNDGDDASVWSSIAHSNPDPMEWVAYWFSGFNNVNYIKLRPRYQPETAPAQGFPVNFNVYWSNGSSWVLANTYTSFPTPQQEWIILPLPTTVNANGIYITTSQLGQDDFGNYVFQLSEVTAGYDAGFNNFQFIGNQNTTRENEIRNVGSDAFNPNKLANWNYDYRYPLIAPDQGNYRNIYAPNIVDNGAWNIYFGGWDGSETPNDGISLTVSSDNFLTFDPHYLMISHGDLNHVNNGTVIKRPDGSWLMYYTTLSWNSPLNKPCYATSSVGTDWTPNSGNLNYLLRMTGYDGWDNADVNGSNVIYYESGTYHLYFIDWQSPDNMGLSVRHATSTDMVNFNYTGRVLDEQFIAQDVKKFSFNNTSYYLMIMHQNGSVLHYSLGSSPTNFAASQELLSNQGNADQYITSAGIVTRGNRLYGVLYGASSQSSMDHNAIYAKWLQKKVIFISDGTGARWGDIERAYGPDRIRLLMNTNIETGHFYVYDTDGITLLYTSPQVTMRSGDIWQYNP